MPRFDGYSLGATLYMPVLHPKIPEFLSGHLAPPASSLVLCLEDALAAQDLERGLARLDLLIATLPKRLPVRVFVRPRNREMARDLCARLCGTPIDGIVAPKVTPETLPDWLDMARDSGLALMPTLEDAQFFDPARIVAIRDILDTAGTTPVAAIRLGGNDLLGSMALRRERGVTSWEGPLGWVLAMASGILVSAGYPVAAPVYDIIDDLDTLHREVIRDVAAGFVSKTAIHPAQVGVIESAFQVDCETLLQAEAILASDARAVFQVGGVMCEPATHKAWAERILARARVFGTVVPQVSKEKTAFG